MKKFFEEHWFFALLVFLLLLLFITFSLTGKCNNDTLAELREARGMVLIEEGLVYNEETHVLYQEVPIYGQYSIYSGFYVPFYDENGKVILFNN